ncbi:MAG: flagellar basal body P-ring protein FlgI [Phycisphaerae bacterium]|nr:flagellar basal body P-ring protein FlgI [Phycisphaerae bacterium]
MRTKSLLILTATAVVLMADAARAAKISDVSRLKGCRTNKLVGHGLVLGLKGTGDGDKYAPAIRPLVQVLEQFANPVLNQEDLKNTKNVAIVIVEVTLPENGVREGDRVDVQVSAIGASKSLIGGRLLITPLLQGADKSDTTVYAMASGALVTDVEHPTTAVIKEGATLEVSILHNYLAQGRELEHHSTLLKPEDYYLTLVLNDVHAEWSMANTVAQIINQEAAFPAQDNKDKQASQEQRELAFALDPKNVVVRVPTHEVRNPASFIAWIEGLDLLMPASEAKILVSRKEGTIVVTGDVEIAPVIISHNGLTINTWVPEPPKPTAAAPKLEEHSWVSMDPQRRGGTKLTELVDALNKLKVPARDRIGIIEKLYKSGKILARWVEVD